METIEERAKNKYNHPVEPYCCESDREEQWYRCGLRDGYIDGATEQRQIDTEKVYHALEKVLSNEVLDNVRKILKE